MLEVRIHHKVTEDERKNIVARLRDFGELKQRQVVKSLVGVDSSMDVIPLIEKIPGVVSVVDGSGSAKLGAQTHTISGALRQQSSTAFSRNNLRTLGIDVDLTRFDLEFAQSVYSLDRGIDGSGIVFAIPDSGVVDCPEFGGRFIGRIYDDYTMSAAYAHANWCTGVAVGESFGIAPGAEIVCARCFETTNALISDTVDAMDALGARHDAEAEQHVINCSFESTSDSYDAVVLDLVDSGIPVVAIAGNSGLNLGANNVYPAETPHAICVGGLGQGKALHPSSNFGDPATVDLYGFYDGHLSVDESGAWQVVQGTSFAGPQIAGIMMLMLQGRPKMTTIQEVKSFYHELRAMSVRDVVGQTTYRRAVYPISASDQSLARS